MLMDYAPAHLPNVQVKQEVKVILYQATSPPQMDASVVFARRCHMSTALKHASLGPHPSWHLNRFMHLLHSSLQSVPILYNGGRPFPPSKLPLPPGIWTFIQYVVPWAHLSPYHKQNFNQFSHFCRAHYCDRPKDRPRYSICSNRLHLHCTVMQPKNNFKTSHGNQLSDSAITEMTTVACQIQISHLRHKLSLMISHNVHVHQTQNERQQIVNFAQLTDI